MTWIEQLETTASWLGPRDIELDSPVDDLVNTGTTGMLAFSRRSSRMTILNVKLRNSQESCFQCFPFYRPSVRPELRR